MSRRARRGVGVLVVALVGLLLLAATRPRGKDPLRALGPYVAVQHVRCSVGPAEGQRDRTLTLKGISIEDAVGLLKRGTPPADGWHWAIGHWSPGRIRRASARHGPNSDQTVDVTIEDGLVRVQSIERLGFLETQVLRLQLLGRDPHDASGPPPPPPPPPSRSLRPPPPAGGGKGARGSKL